MASLISHFYRFLLQRANIFGKPGESLAVRRARLEKVVRLAKPPRGITVQAVDVDGIPAEWEIPAGATDNGAILYIHGGAWAICSPRTHRLMVAQLAKAAGTRALSIDYRLAPEHPFPAALEDCVMAYRWLLAQGFAPQKIVIAGDSAGGNLALATLLALRDCASPGKACTSQGEAGTSQSEAGAPLPAAAVCLSPATDLASTGDSLRSRASLEVLLRRLKGSSVVDRYAGGHDVYDPLLSPLYGDLRGLPPILIHVGDHEILLDDSTRFVERACAAGVDARVVVWPSMWHVFQMFAPSMPEARESIRQMGEFIKEELWDARDRQGLSVL